MEIETRRNKVFGGIIYGKFAITKHNHKIFLEAIYNSTDAASCISRIISSDKGLPSLQSAMRYDLTPAFMNNHATKLIGFLQNKELADIGRGVYLQKILLAIVEPPIFWDAYTQALRNGSLHDAAFLAFSWLLEQLMKLPAPQAKDYIESAKDSTILGLLLSSSSQEVRAHAYKIKHMIDVRTVASSMGSECAPGGRHDNDFADFRQIAIMPTTDELDSTEPPFLRSTKVRDDDVDADSSLVATHLDNQFRLNREDMLYEMREEIQIIRGLKKGRRRNSVIDGLQLVGIHCEDSSKRYFYRCRWAVKLECQQDLWPDLANSPFDKRKQHVLGCRSTVLRHQSVACLLADGEVVAFPRINRVEDLLAAHLPIIALELEGELSTCKTFLKLKTAQNVQLLQIETPIFAYEPILKALQEKKTLPLSAEILRWTPTSVIDVPDCYPARVVDLIRNRIHGDLGPLLGISKSVTLDPAQGKSLLAGLTQKLSLIQGPPGKYTAPQVHSDLLTRSYYIIRDW
jgi:hypothetical protein